MTELPRVCATTAWGPVAKTKEDEVNISQTTLRIGVALGTIGAVAVLAASAQAATSKPAGMSEPDIPGADGPQRGAEQALRERGHGSLAAPVHGPLSGRRKPDGAARVRRARRP